MNIFLKHTCKTYNIVFAIGRNCSMCGKYSNTLALSVGNSLGSSIECNIRNHEILVHVFLSNIGYCSYNRINRINRSGRSKERCIRVTCAYFVLQFYYTIVSSLCAIESCRNYSAVIVGLTDRAIDKSNTAIVYYIEISALLIYCGNRVGELNHCAIFLSEVFGDVSHFFRSSDNIFGSCHFACLAAIDNHSLNGGIGSDADSFGIFGRSSSRFCAIECVIYLTCTVRIGNRHFNRSFVVCTGLRRDYRSSYCTCICCCYCDSINLYSTFLARQNHFVSRACPVSATHCAFISIKISTCKIRTTYCNFCKIATIGSFKSKYSAIINTGLNVATRLSESHNSVA